jgi:tetratricopeptide (TPR) repeat protein
MITGSDISVEKFSQAPFDSQIRVGTPATEVFVGNRGFTLKNIGQGSSIQLEQETVEESSSTSADEILEGVVSNGKRDLDRGTDSARPHVNLGLSFMNRGMLREAEDELSIALKRDRRHFVAGMALARIRAVRGDLDGAAELYESLSEGHSGELLPKTGLAYIAMQRGKFEEAEQILRSVVREDRRNIWAKYHLGLVFLKLDKLQEAIGSLREAARAGVRFPAIHHALGVAYAQKGDLRKAIRSFSMALNLAPTMKETVHAFSDALLRFDEHERAISILRNYLEREESESLETREILVRAYFELGRHREARTELEKMWEIANKKKDVPAKVSATILSNIGFCFAVEKNKDAEAYFKRALTCSDEEPFVYTNLGRWYLSQQRFEESTSVLLSGRKKFPSNQDIRLLLGISYEHTGHFDAAARELIHLISTEQQPPAAAYALLGFVLSGRKREPELAENILETGYKRYPNHHGIANNYAYVLLLQGKVELAKAVLESQSWQNDTVDSVYLTATLGLLRLWQGSIKEGQARYQEAEKIAALLGKATLSRTVRQKMHLELAKAFLRMGDGSAAAIEVQRGLQVRGAGVPLYKEDLEMLEAKFDADLETNR